MNKINKILVGFCLSLAVSLPAVFASLETASAANLTTNDVWGGNKAAVQSQTGLGEKDPRDIAANVINVILGFLGIVAVVIILLGGFKWMTAAGNEDKVEEAKKLISAGIIGLVIILAAFGIAKFVIDSLLRSTGGV